MDTNLFEQAESQTGKKVARVRFELDYLRRNGLLVDINIGGTGMFTRGASFLELGVGADGDDERQKRYTPGSKFLIDKVYVDKLRSVEVRMRQLIEKCAMDVQGFRPYRWLPWTGYEAFKAKWESLREEFEQVKLEILAVYDAQMDNLSYEFAAGARQTWKQVAQGGYTALIINDRGKAGRAFTNQDAFVDWVVQMAQAAMPTPEKIQAELTADYKVGLIATEYDEQIDMAQAQKARDEQRAAKQAAYMQESILQEQYNHQARMIAMAEQEKSQEIEEREMKLAAMRAAELEHAKAQIAGLKSPFEEVFIALRQQIADDCQEILASMQKNGYVRGKVAERARGLVELYDLMAAHNDKELRAKLVELRSQIGPGGQDTPARDTAAITGTLEQIMGLAHVQAEDLAAVSRASFLEIA
jgi:hypothetical protein